MKSYKPKTVSKKQQLADQHRREKVLTDTPLYRVGAMQLVKSYDELYIYANLFFQMMITSTF